MFFNKQLSDRLVFQSPVYFLDPEYNSPIIYWCGYCSLNIFCYVETKQVNIMIIDL